MPALETILLFFIADLVICLTPGPATAIAASYAASGGMRASWGPVAGIHLGNFIWYGLSAFGLAALITAAPDVYTAIRWAGVAYLLWMGWRMIRASANSQSLEKKRNLGFGYGLIAGLAVHMSNPKALLFYVSFLPQFIDPGDSIALQIFVFASVTVVTESIGLLTYAYIAASAQKLAQARIGEIPFDRIAGTVLILVAGLMAIMNIAE